MLQQVTQTQGLAPRPSLVPHWRSEVDGAPTSEGQGVTGPHHPGGSGQNLCPYLRGLPGCPSTILPLRARDQQPQFPSATLSDNHCSKIGHSHFWGTTLPFTVALGTGALAGALPMTLSLLGDPWLPFAHLLLGTQVGWGRSGSWRYKLTIVSAGQVPQGLAGNGEHPPA